MKVCPVCDREFGDGEFVRCDRVECPADESKLVSVNRPQPTADPLVGAMLTDRIRILARIGEGGMGAVYKGEDVLLGRTVAVKVLHQNLKGSVDDVKRFFNEARVVAKLRHPNTIQVFDFGESNAGHAYIAMEFMTGEPLDAFMEKGGLTLARVLEIVEQVCLSLEEAHAAGIIHRDLKPDNVFIDTVNNRRIVKVIDFGIAKLLSGGENLTQTGMVFGTPAYMSPEQARGETVDARSDIYSLGCVLFAMLAGRTPFVGAAPMEIAVQHVTTPAPSVQEHSRFGELPPALVELVERMLSKSVDDRPANISEVRRALVDIARNTPGLRLEATRDTGALIAVGSGPTEYAPATPASGTTNPVPHTHVTIPPQRGSALMPLIVVVGVVLLAAAGALVLAVGGGDDAGATPGGETVVADPAAAPVSAAVAEGSVEPAAGADNADVAGAVDAASREVRAARSDATLAAREATVSIRLTSTPAGARVADADGRVLGQTPLEWNGRRGDGVARLSIELEGYEPASREVPLAQDFSASVSLSRVAAARTNPREPERRPEATPAPAEPSTEGTGGRRGRFVPRDPVTIPVGP